MHVSVLRAVKSAPGHGVQPMSHVGCGKEWGEARARLDVGF